jgi:hypothetical protein
MALAEPLGKHAGVCLVVDSQKSFADEHFDPLARCARSHFEFVGNVLNTKVFIRCLDDG